MTQADGAGASAPSTQGETNVVTSDSGSQARPEGEAPATTRGDVSAVTVARMMGLATLGEVKLVESKVELLATKISTVQVKLEKIFSLLQGVPSGADLERIDIHIGAMKQMLKEFLVARGETPAATGEPKKPSSKIVTN